MWQTILRYALPALASAVGPVIKLVAGDPKGKLEDIKKICEHVKAGELEPRTAIDIIAELIAE